MTVQIPDDVMKILAEGAAQLHDLYVIYVQAGFTESQAMEIILATFTAMATPEETGSSYDR